jgi:Domain of unknown function (DUF1836).
MTYNKELIAGKLRRWEKYLDDYRLPAWEEIPDIGLYMDQVVTLLTGYLDYLPPELKEEQVITPAAINNYVRKKIMPEPVKKKYYRSHIAYLIMVCTLKQSLSIPTLKTMIPMGLDEEELRRVYSAYIVRHRLACSYFVREVRIAAGGILDHGPEDETELTTADTNDLISTVAVISGFARLMAEKLLLLEGKDLSDGGSVEPRRSHDRD